MNDDVPTLPLLVQHDAAASAATMEGVARGFIGRRTILAFDLPGLGDSDAIITDPNADVGQFADVLRAVLDTFGLTQVDYYGLRGGGLVGLEMAVKEPARIRRLVMSSVYHHAPDAQRFVDAMPEITPLWHGGHLMDYWHQLRDQGLYYPWFDKTKANVIRHDPQLDVHTIHARVCSLLKAGSNYRISYGACVRYPTYDKLAQLKSPVIFGTTKAEPNPSHTEAAVKINSKFKARQFDANMRKWNEGFLDVLEDADRGG
jgi:pimeloyl-ACP methyl ester carboxylesterase